MDLGWQDDLGPFHVALGPSHVFHSPRSIEAEARRAARRNLGLLVDSPTEAALTGNPLSPFDQDDSEGLRPVIHKEDFVTDPDGHLGRGNFREIYFDRVDICGSTDFGYG